MLHNNCKKDRYCRFTYNPATGEQEREWIKYEDGTYEPVRRAGKLSQKWNDQRTNFKWWAERKPAEWRPEDDGAAFAWNHTLGEENKPVDWGNNPEHEIEAGRTPYSMSVDLNGEERIASRIENIDGRRETWEFSYDDEGQLSACIGDTGWSQEFEYDDKDRRTRDYEVGRVPLARDFIYDEDNRLLSAGDVVYEHDENGFRTAKRDGKTVTLYAYAPDYRLLGATLSDGREIAYQHGQGGLRRFKYINGEVAEEYVWRDFIRLEAFQTKNNAWQFHYEGEDRLPHMATVNNVQYTLHYDQVGSLKAVVSETGNVVKTIQYGPFGDILWDSSPGLRVPLGFAGGLYDPHTNLTRFGWRDYDPDTGRWTAQDPIGDAGGDEDWYGYCLDDPLNGADPLGLGMFGTAGLGTMADSLAEAYGDRMAAKGYADEAGKARNTSLYSRSNDKKEADARSAAQAEAKSAAQAEAKAAEVQAKAETEQRMTNMYAQRQDEKAKTIAQHTAAWAKQEANLTEKAAQKTNSVIGASTNTDKNPGYGGAKAAAEDDDGLAELQADTSQNKIETKPASSLMSDDLAAEMQPWENARMKTPAWNDPRTSRPQHASLYAEQLNEDLEAIQVNESFDVPHVAAARRHVGSSAYSVEVANGDFKAGQYKCNQFVSDTLQAAGIDVPSIGGWLGGDPPAADAWGDPNTEIEGFAVTKNPKTGDIASDGIHVGIVSGPGTTISASSKTNTVVENDWGFREDQKGGITFKTPVN